MAETQVYSGAGISTKATGVRGVVGGEIGGQHACVGGKICRQVQTAAVAAAVVEERAARHDDLPAVNAPARRG